MGSSSCPDSRLQTQFSCPCHQPLLRHDGARGRDYLAGRDSLHHSIVTWRFLNISRDIVLLAPESSVHINIEERAQAGGVHAWGWLAHYA